MLLKNSNSTFAPFSVPSIVPNSRFIFSNLSSRRVLSAKNDISFNSVLVDFRFPFNSCTILLIFFMLGSISTINLSVKKAIAAINNLLNAAPKKLTALPKVVITPANLPNCIFKAFIGPVAIECS